MSNKKQKENKKEDMVLCPYDMKWVPRKRAKKYFEEAKKKFDQQNAGYNSETGYVDK